MSESLLQIAMKHYPCEKEQQGWAWPDCFTDDYGKCEVDENAIYCPKYGQMLGIFRKYGSLLVDKVVK